MNKQELHTFLKKHKLDKHTSQIEKLLRHEIKITPNPMKEKYLKLGQSKLGGCPDLPDNKKWFRGDSHSLAFVAQINFAEIKPFDKENQLPDKGIAWFFCSTREHPVGNGSEDQNKFKVYYCEFPKNLRRMDYPGDLEEHERFKPCQIIAEESISIPVSHDDFSRFLSNNEEDLLYDEMFYLPNIRRNKMLGYADTLHHSTMIKECVLALHDLYGIAKPRGVKQKKSAAEWQLLLQVDSNEEIEMNWYDEGKLYFWMRAQDLREKKFDYCQCILNID